MRKHRIAFLEDDTADGGLGMVFRSLAKELSKDNEILYLSVNPERDDTKSYARYIGIKEIKKFDLLTNGIERCLTGVKPLINILRSNKPDIVISFGFYANMRSCLAGRLFPNIKILVSERGNAKRFKGVNLFIVSSILRRADGFVFQSKAAQNVFPEYIKKKSRVIYNAVFKANLSKDDYKIKNNEIVSVGRIHPDKNFPLLTDAFSKIEKKYPTLQLVIYGEEEKGSKKGYMSLLKQQVSDLNLDSKVKFPGHVSNVYERIKNSRLFVLSSVLEGMPNALVEAMSYGLPVITTDFEPGNACEFVENKLNGLIVKSNNPEELAKAMDYMLSNPKEAERMALKALEINERLDSTEIFSQWREYINVLCQ